MEYLDLGELQDELLAFENDDILNVELTGVFGSYRGSPDTLFIEYNKGGRNYSTVAELTSIIDNAIGEFMPGYKGGGDTLDRNSGVCFALGRGYVGGLFPIRVAGSFDGVQIIT